MATFDWMEVVVAGEAWKTKKQNEKGLKQHELLVQLEELPYYGIWSRCEEAASVLGNLLLLHHGVCAKHET